MYVNRKMISIETIAGMGDKGQLWKVRIQVWYIWFIVRTFVNTIMYPYPEQ
jgi:hypothetical protein